MKILENLHELVDLSSIKGQLDMEKDAESIEELKKYTKCDIPQEYINFLQEINGGIIGVEQENGSCIGIAFHSVEDILGFYEDTALVNWLKSDDMLPIGDDMGCFTLFYGNGKEGFGIYQAFNTNMNYNGEFTFKLADSLIDLLVNGVGLDRVFSTKM